jgi:hypothetical protein
VERARKQEAASVQPKREGVAFPEAVAPHAPETAADERRSAVVVGVDGFAVAGDFNQFAAVAGSEDISRYCPVCSQRLESRRCKLICPQCGYYMSCADYY